MKYLEEAKIFLSTFIVWIVLLFVLTIFFFLFGVGSIEIAGKTILVPILSKYSFSVEVFQNIVKVVVPQDIPIIVTGPLTAFFTQIKIAFLLAFIASFPFLLYRLISYLKPALYKNEIGYIYRIIIPSSFLFIAGSLFAYLYILPITFEVLYSYAEPLGAVTFLSAQELIALTSVLVLATGISFMLPVLMVLLCAMHIVPISFWVEKWRYAIVIFLILSAIITPDGSGISMIMLSIPIALLYGLGLLISLQLKTSTKINQNES